MVSTLVSNSSGLNQPKQVAADASGNVFFADSSRHAIYQWTASTRQVKPLVTSGLFEPNGVALDRSGNLYIPDTTNNAIKKCLVGPGTPE